jgi:hypothetical protein
MRARLICGAAIVALATWGAAAAADKADPTYPDATIIQEKPTTASIFKFDYGAPTSPALMLGGISPDKATTSTALKPFVLSLPYFVGGHAASQAIAFDFAPAAAYWNNWNFTKYLEASYPQRLLARTRIETLAFRGQADTDPKKQVASKIAVGASVSLLDDSDPFFAREWVPFGKHPKFSWQDCTRTAMDKYSGMLSVPSPAAGSDEVYGHARALQGLIEKNKQLGLAPDAGLFPGQQTRIDQVVARIAALKDQKIPTDFAKDPNFQVQEGIGDARYWAERLPDSDPRRKAILDALDAARKAVSDPRPADKTPHATFADLTAALSTPDASGKTGLDLLGGVSQKVGDEAKRYENALATQSGYTKAVSGCADAANGWARLAPDIDVGIGTIWYGAKGDFQHFGEPGQVVWLGARYPIHVFGITADNDPTKATAIMFGGSARLARNAEVSTGVTATPNFQANTRDIWLGLQALGPSYNAGFQYGWFHATARDSTLASFNQSGAEWLVNLGKRLGGDKSGNWINISYGKAAGTATVRDDKTVLVTFTFSTPKAQDLFLPPAK